MAIYSVKFEWVDNWCAKFAHEQIFFSFSVRTKHFMDPKTNEFDILFGGCEESELKKKNKAYTFYDFFSMPWKWIKKIYVLSEFVLFCFRSGLFMACIPIFALDEQSTTLKSLTIFRQQRIECASDSNELSRRKQERKIKPCVERCIIFFHSVHRTKWLIVYGRPKCMRVYVWLRTVFFSALCAKLSALYVSLENLVFQIDQKHCHYFWRD